jgi:uncharacterized protein YjbI with pentapeptide repeats
MRRPSANYAPLSWWPWYAEVENVLGASGEKIRAQRIRLRRITKKAWWRIIRLGWCARADLHNANLRGAYLHGSNLSGAILVWADLSNANLICADLSNADLRYANLSGADLSDANLSKANLDGANLDGAKYSS